MKKQNLEIVHKNQEQQQNVVSDSESKEIENLYEVLKELPKPQNMNLTAAQIKWWYWFGLEFVKTKQLTSTDLVHLQNAAVSMDARCKLIKIINAENKKSNNGVGGWVQRFASGATNVTGYQTMYEKATKQLDDISAHFGLSFKDRKKLGAIENANEGQLDLFQEVVNRLHG